MFALGRARRHRRAHRDPAAKHPRSAPGVGGRRSRFFGSSFWQAYYVEATIFFVTICILLLRGLEAAMVERHRAGDVGGAALPAHRVDGRALVGALAARPRDRGVSRRDGQDPHLVRVDDHDLPPADDGCRLAPVPRLPQHLAQAGVVRSHGARGGQAAHGGGQAVRHGRHGGDGGGRRARGGRASRTSRGRACSTSPRAPSAAAASRSAPRGTPTSRCRPSCS